MVIHRISDETKITANYTDDIASSSNFISKDGQTYQLKSQRIARWIRFNQIDQADLQGPIWKGFETVREYLIPGWF